MKDIVEDKRGLALFSADVEVDVAYAEYVHAAAEDGGCLRVEGGVIREQLPVLCDVNVGVIGDDPVDVVMRFMRRHGGLVSVLSSSCL